MFDALQSVDAPQLVSAPQLGTMTHVDERWATLPQIPLVGIEECDVKRMDSTRIVNPAAPTQKNTTKLKPAATKKEGKRCQHNRIRSQCKDCGGGSICQHKRIRSQYKECKGGSICTHGQQRSKCKDCGGGSICVHKRIRSQCKDCGG